MKTKHVSLGIFINRKGRLFTLFASSLTLTLGILALVYLIAFPAFKFLNNFMFPVLILIILFFSLVYSYLWVLLLKRINFLLNKSPYPIS